MRGVTFTVFAGIVFCVVNGTAQAQLLSNQLKTEGAVSLAKAAREQGDAVRGAVLLPQQTLGCVNCHAVGGKALLGPDLTQPEKPTNMEHLVEAILQPSKAIRPGYESVTVVTKSGAILVGRILEQGPQTIVLRITDRDAAVSGGQLLTLARSEVQEVHENKASMMPDNLVDQLSGRQQFLDLIKYLMALASAEPHAAVREIDLAGGGMLNDELRGLVLLDRFKCAACHGALTAKWVLPPSEAADLSWSRGRIDPDYIERFLVDPFHVKPGTTMPDLLSGLTPESRRETARAIAHFLASGGLNRFEYQPIDSTAAGRGSQLFHKVGCVACHSPRDDHGRELLAESSEPLGRIERKYNVNGLVDLLKNPRSVRPAGRMPDMQLTHWEALDIAHYLLQDASVEGPQKLPFDFDRALAEQGKQHFQELECARCHGKNEVSPWKDYRLTAGGDGQRGCLSGRAGPWPQFPLDDSQRHAIRTSLRHSPRDLTNQEQIEVTLAALNCVACHQRENLGGVSSDRDEFFHTTNPNLGPQGRIPPPLTGVGAKLTPSAIRQVMIGGQAVRPYMATRMPQFGSANVEHLIRLFPLVDQLPAVRFPDVSDQKQLKDTGAELAGSSGFNCIACHDFQQKPAPTMPAVDLTVMAERLRRDWFYHYLRSPQRFNPGTVMPSFWPGGTAMRAEYLGGDSDLQIAALWQYLLDGRQARTPRGLIVESIELLATDEAVILRRSYPGVGKRGIGVGYPGQVNLVFDAEQMRLGTIWKGKFADPGGVFRSQGHGTVRPLGTDLIQFAPGSELDNAESPWQVDEGRPPQHHFRGYYLDDRQRPTFMYRFENIEVDDYPVDVIDESAGGRRIRRTLTFNCEQSRGKLAFRVATGQSIIPHGEDSFLIDNTLRIRCDRNHPAQIIDALGGKQLRIPLELTAGRSQLVLEYAW